MLHDYFKYAQYFHKIKTKIHGVQPFTLRQYQKDYINQIQSIKGPVRSIVLKPRQAGFTTLVSSFFAWKMATNFNFRGIGLADQYDRTLEMSQIYSHFFDSLEIKVKPSILKDNDERLILDNEKSTGLGSGIKYSTARDKNAGRAGSRLFAHLTEAAFFLYPDEIDDGIQNSIPLADNSFVIKESTANGKQGVGKAFFDLWTAAVAGESLYKPYFVSWFKIDDYTIDLKQGLQLTDTEKEIMLLEPNVTQGNLAWRRLKLSEYRSDKENQALSPEERFKQDFPLTPEEAFLNSGRPVFDQTKLNRIITNLRNAMPKNFAEHIKTENHVLKNRLKEFKIFQPPRDNRQYFVGADISEGLDIGDSSAICVLDHDLKIVATWKGKIDPDLMGHLLIGIGEMYNNALLIPEKNNMGLTTVITIRNAGYYKIYKKIIEDKTTKERRTELGWRTTSLSKMEMLNETISLFREGDLVPIDIDLAIEMGNISRGANGDVELNGQDRVVSLCLAVMGWKQYKLPIESIVKKSREYYDTYQEKRSGDLFS